MTEPAPTASTSSRRAVLDWVLATATGGFLLSVFYPILRYLVPPRMGQPTSAEVTLDFSAAEVRPNSGKVFRFGGQPGILIRTPGGELRAFSAVCTHLECTVQYRSDVGQIWCACHDGHYDLQGKNVSGPPPRPLLPYEVRVREGQITVRKGA
jgi:Rieske Fe-S protein